LGGDAENQAAEQTKAHRSQTNREKLTLTIVHPTSPLVHLGWFQALLRISVDDRGLTDQNREPDDPFAAA
jgi:hypothetical protein